MKRDEADMTPVPTLTQVPVRGEGAVHPDDAGSVGASARLLSVVEDAVRQLHAGTPDLPAVTASSVLDRDLGLDSLARMELLLRIERAFGVDLPEDTLQRAETVAHLLEALRRAPAAAGGPAAAASWRDARTAVAPAVPVRGEGTPQDAQHLIEVLEWHCREHPEQIQHIVLHDGGEQSVSYRQLREASQAVAAGLQRRGIAARQCVAIMLPTSREYFSVYLGILMAGAIPVPIYPPARPSQLEDHVLRHAAILRNALAVGMITVGEGRGVARLLKAHAGTVRWVATPDELAAGGGAVPAVALRSDDIAFIQYTSGSTGQPKGVALTHANLLANIRAMAEAVQATPRDVFVSWLPLYHDMGLIGAWLAPLYVGFPLVVMSPLAFLSRPSRWLEAIHRWRGTLSAGPNFAYELCLKRIDDAALQGLDLSCWRLAFNGAEAVSPDTVRRFSERFAVCGLRPQAVAPVYGLAEASVGLLFPPLGRIAPIDVIDRAAFTRDHRARPVSRETPDALRFVACGQALPGHAVRVVDEAGAELGERIEGRLEFRGPSATRGYYRNPQQTAKLLRDGWLDTGDRAYIADGDVYLTGRVKDIVIRGGRNLYPAEIEEAVGAVQGIRKGCVAVFGSPDATTGTERLVVLAEARTTDGAERATLRDAVTRAVIGAIGEPPDVVALAPPHTVLKTSSGKIRRSACRELWETGRAEGGPGSARVQVLRLALRALIVRVTDAWRGLGARLGVGLGGLRIVLAFGLFAPATWIATLFAGSPAAAWDLGGRAARGWLRSAGLPLAVRGLEHLPHGPCVLVSNHASYLDGLILVAALPQPFAFVAKRELEGQFVAGTYLRRLGSLFVERFDARRSVADAGRIAQAVRSGRSLAVFPEGTFVAAAELLPFHLGAFLAAADAGVPVVPVVLQGSRTLLPAKARWPRPAALQVEVMAPIAPVPAPDLFGMAVGLRSAARQAMQQRLGDE